MEFRDSKTQDYNEIVHCIYKGFEKHFKLFKISEEKIKNMLLNIVKLEQFKVAVDDGKVIACCGVAKGGNRLYKKEEYSFYKEFGLVKGFIIAQLVYQALGKPYNEEADCGYFEYVTTLEAYQGKGIMKKLIKWTIENSAYPCYMLDVASNNEAAIKLYEKLGFVESHRVKEKFAKYTGFEYLIFMKFSL